VEVSAELSADLSLLTAALDQPDIDLETLLRRLADTITSAVDSYLGVSVTLVVDDHPLSLTMLQDDAEQSDIASSVLMPLPRLCSAEPGSVLVFYAAKAGAFVDFAADISYVLKLEPGVLVLDKDLTLSPELGKVSGLRQLSRLNQAIGILIEDGHTPEAATAELNRLARSNHTTPSGAAQRLIDAIGQAS
jgi:hypothetical protein